jgi:hypothetical protein
MVARSPDRKSWTLHPVNTHRPTAGGVQNLLFFAVFLAYVWAGVDPRLIYQWQAPVSSTIPGFLSEFLTYPGGVSFYLYALAAQADASRLWGAIVITAQVGVVVALTEVYFKALAGRALPLVRFAPALLLLYHLNLYRDRTPVALALILGLAPAVLFVHLSQRWSKEAALAAACLVLLTAAYYLGGMAIVFFAPAAALAQAARRPRRPIWLVYLLLAAALPMAVETFRLMYVPASARSWFVYADARAAVVCWSLYVFYALGGAIVLLRRPVAPRRERLRERRLTTVLVTACGLLGLCLVAAVSYRLNSRERLLGALDYNAAGENWSAVINASSRLSGRDFNAVSRYEINLALHEMNRLGDDMFRFPQEPPLLLDLQIVSVVPYMVQLTDMCLRLGRVNEAEHFGGEVGVKAQSDPRLYQVMARVNMVKGEIAAARKYLTVLSYDLVYGPWARQRLRELERDPQLDANSEIQLLRRRMVRQDDMLPVWQRADDAGADVERLLLDQLQQDPSNRMAFEFLMGTYLLNRNIVALHALMPRMKDMTGPAYEGPAGERRTPRYYQEGMLIYADTTGTAVNVEGFEIQPETIKRAARFKAILTQFRTREAARQAAWNAFRDTYFFYFTFGPGDYR